MVWYRIGWFLAPVFGPALTTFGAAAFFSFFSAFGADTAFFSPFVDIVPYHSSTSIIQKVNVNAFRFSYKRNKE
jgi:hypothetical protein